MPESYACAATCTTDNRADSDQHERTCDAYTDKDGYSNMDKIAPNRNGDKYSQFNGDLSGYIEWDADGKAYLVTNVHIEFDEDSNAYIVTERDSIRYPIADTITERDFTDDSGGARPDASQGDTDAASPKFRLIGAGDTGVDADPDCNGNA